MPKRPFSCCQTWSCSPVCQVSCMPTQPSSGQPAPVFSWLARLHLPNTPCGSRVLRTPWCATLAPQKPGLCCYPIFPGSPHPLPTVIVPTSAPAPCSSPRLPCCRRLTPLQFQKPPGARLRQSSSVYPAQSTGLGYRAPINLLEQSSEPCPRSPCEASWFPSDRAAPALSALPGPGAALASGRPHSSSSKVLTQIGTNDPSLGSRGRVYSARNSSGRPRCGSQLPY